MGYILRVRFAAFFVGAAVASIFSIYFLHQDYNTAHESLSQQVNSLCQSMEGRISALEKLQEAKGSKPVDAEP